MNSPVLSVNFIFNFVYRCQPSAFVKGFIKAITYLLTYLLFMVGLICTKGGSNYLLGARDPFFILSLENIESIEKWLIIIRLLV